MTEGVVYCVRKEQTDGAPYARKGGMFMKKPVRFFLLLAAVLALALSALFVGCSHDDPYVLSIEQTAQGEDGTVFTVTYSDGSTSEFTVRNGEDGEDVSIQDVYEYYKQATGEDISYADFLELYLDLTTDNAAAIGQSLLSAVNVYSEFVVASEDGGAWIPGFPHWGSGGTSTRNSAALYTGAGVIWSMDTAAGGYSYIVTNYHVVYNSAAAAVNGETSETGGGQYIARKLHVYLYGSGQTPGYLDENGDNIADTDEDGYTKYAYGSSAVACEYVGGSVSCDVAVLRAETADILAVNEDACPVDVAEDYYVGESVYTIGNPEGDGFSVTEGIISVDNEYITLDIDGTERSYRSIRTDVALYSGNSGGGLFNNRGQLVGLSNAGKGDEENINYAVPLPVVRGAVENILHYHRAEGTLGVTARRLTLGFTGTVQNSKYVYDAATGRGRIVETVQVSSVSASSIAGGMGIEAGDVLTHLVVNGQAYAIERDFDIYDILLTVFAGDEISFRYTRGGTAGEGTAYTVEAGAPQAV